MISFRGPFIAGAALLLIAACEKRDPVAPEAANAAGLPELNEPAPDVTGAPPAGESEPASDTHPARAASKIPAALQGLWGLSPADCDSQRSDAKGLLVITPDDVHFYESRAVPSANVESDADSISGNFSFTGEGQSWTKYQALKVNGRELVRTETNPAASFSYAKCT